MHRIVPVLGIFGILVIQSCKNRDIESLPSTESAWSSDTLDATISLSIQTANSLMHLNFFPEKLNLQNQDQDASGSDVSTQHLDLFSMGVEESLRRSAQIYREMIESPDDSHPDLAGIAANQLTALNKIKSLYQSNLAIESEAQLRSLSSWIEGNQTSYQEFVREYEHNAESLVRIRDSIREKQPSPNTNLQNGIYAQSPSIAACVVEIFVNQSPDDPEPGLVLELVPDTSADNDPSCQPALLKCSAQACTGRSASNAVSVSETNAMGFVLATTDSRATFIRRDTIGSTRFKASSHATTQASTSESRTIIEPYLSNTGETLAIRSEHFNGNKLIGIGHYLCRDRRCSQQSNTKAQNDVIELDVEGSPTSGNSGRISRESPTIK